MAMGCYIRTLKRASAMGLMCCSVVLTSSCDSPHPEPAQAGTDVTALTAGPTAKQDISENWSQGPSEPAAEGVEVTQFTSEQRSALYVTMSIEGMEVDRNGYDIAPEVAEAPLAGMEFRVPSDTKARWGLIDVTQKDADSSIIFTHRVGPSGVTYSMRHYNCEAHTVRYLATGETTADMRNSKADERMSEIVPRSIAHYLGKLACTNLTA